MLERFCDYPIMTQFCYFILDNSHVSHEYLNFCGIQYFLIFFFYFYRVVEKSIFQISIKKIQITFVTQQLEPKLKKLRNAKNTLENIVNQGVYIIREKSLQDSKNKISEKSSKNIAHWTIPTTSNFQDKKALSTCKT